MGSKVKSWYFALHLFKDHIYSIILLWWVLILEMVGDSLQYFPHLQPSLFFDAPQCAQQATWLKSLFGREKYRKLTVVKIVFEGQLNSITDYHRHTMIDNGVKKPATWRCVPSWMKAEAWRSHTLSRLQWRCIWCLAEFHSRIKHKNSQTNLIVSHNSGDLFDTIARNNLYR